MIKILIIIILLAGIFWLVCAKSMSNRSMGYDDFDPSTTEFVHPNTPVRYDLRGWPLKQYSIDKYYIRPDRRIRLSASGGEMYESNYSPMEEGTSGCRRVACPPYGYDRTDTCFKCSDPHPLEDRCYHN